MSRKKSPDPPYTHCSDSRVQNQDYPGFSGWSSSNGYLGTSSVWVPGWGVKLAKVRADFVLLAFVVCIEHVPSEEGQGHWMLIYPDPYPQTHDIWPSPLQTLPHAIPGGLLIGFTVLFLYKCISESKQIWFCYINNLDCDSVCMCVCVFEDQGLWAPTHCQLAKAGLLYNFEQHTSLVLVCEMKIYLLMPAQSDRCGN